MSLIRQRRQQIQNWSPFEQMTQLRNQINRLFESPADNMLSATNFFEGWTPAIDVYEDRDVITVKAELPGMKKEDLDISLHENTLTISGERKQEQEGQDDDMYRSERFFGRFQRSITLPYAVDPEKISASYKDGILTVTLSKAEHAKPKQIQVNAS
jgi:HSP20 family protein